MSEQLPREEDCVAAEGAVDMAATESGGIIGIVLDTLMPILGYIAHMADAMPVPFPFNCVAVGMGLVFVTVIGFYIGIFVAIVVAVGLSFFAPLGFFGFGFLNFR